MADTTYSAELIGEYKTALAEMRGAAPIERVQSASIRNIEDLSLDDVTEDLLIEQFLDMGEELGVDTRQGSIYWDACMGSIIRTAMLFDDLAQIKEIISIQTCTGDVLDEKMMERGLKRNPDQATPATYYVEFTGAVPEIGSLMSCGDYFFTLHQEENGKYTIVSQDTGTEMNDLVAGTAVIPDLDVDGLISATLGALYIPAVDIEDDDSARERLISRLSGPDENGNKAQMKTWCESVDGVGSARIIPLWNGPNTVKAVIVSKTGGVPVTGVVQAVQKYLDPSGDGMGEGVATIGQICTVAAAEAVTINIKASVLKKSDASLSGIQSAFKALLEKYFSDMALEDYSQGMTIRYVRVGALLEGLEDVIDYSNLTINDGMVNIPFAITQVPILGEVTIDGNIQ